MCGCYVYQDMCCITIPWKSNVVVGTISKNFDWLEVLFLRSKYILLYTSDVHRFSKVGPKHKLPRLILLRAWTFIDVRGPTQHNV